MADLADQADRHYQPILDAAIIAIRQAAVIPQNLTGVCLHCKDPVPGTRRWCDADCRDLYERKSDHG